MEILTSANLWFEVKLARGEMVRRDHECMYQIVGTRYNVHLVSRVHKIFVHVLCWGYGRYDGISRADSILFNSSFTYNVIRLETILYHAVYLSYCL